MTRTSELFRTSFAAIAVTVLASAMVGRPLPAGAQATVAPAIDNDDIGGVVTGPNGPEAGVWVIAESVELPTKFAKMVVTDDQGRYVIPDLPAVNYSVWVRGYGLVDSPKMRAKPGQHLDLAAVAAPNAAAAAHYYPAIYWYSMLKIPPESELSGTAIYADPGASKIDGQLAPPNEEHRLHGLPPDRSGSDPHDSGSIRLVQNG